MDRKIYVLGAGQVRKKHKDTVHVDLRPWKGVDIVHDLEKTPWPIAEGAARHANATHVIEHIRNFEGFMDECWRILSPGGTLFLETPNVKDQDLAFSDPTHVRYFTKHTFINYLTLEGVHQHGIFRHAWTFLHLEDTGSLIRAHMAPVPDDYLTDEAIDMWEAYKNRDSHG